MIMSIRFKLKLKQCLNY